MLPDIVIAFKVLAPNKSKALMRFAEMKKKQQQQEIRYACMTICSNYIYLYNMYTSYNY